jgi:multidrug efflux pump subunit AcrB
VSFPSWLGRHGRSVSFLFVIVALVGLASAPFLPVGLFPRTTFPRVVVSVAAGDRPADRMVLEVTRPIEETVRGVPGLHSLRSLTSRGTCEISINFDWGVDMIAATLQVQTAISQILRSLPPEVSFEVRRMDPTVFPIIGLSLTSQSASLVHLRDVARFEIAPLLSSVPGVANVGVQGGETPEIQVLVDPGRLEASGLTLDEVAKTVSAANVVTAVGRLQQDEKLYLLLADTSIASLDELRSVVVRRSDEGVVLLGDVADIRASTVPQWIRVTADGREAVLVNVYQQPEGSALDVEREVRKRLGDFALRAPRDLQVRWWYDQTEVVSASLRSLRESIIAGVALAIVVLWLFLRDVRLTAIAAACVPLALGATLLALTGLGDSLNIMTLGGMAAAVGLIIDDGIVVVEHIERRRAEGASSSPLAAAREVMTPLVASSAATIVILAPLAYLSGVTGVFFRALSATMAIALALSLGVAACIVPVMAGAPGAGGSPVSGNRPHTSPLRTGYERVLRGALAHPRLGYLAVALLLAAGLASTRFVSVGFLPAMDEGGFVLDYRTPPGTSLRETDRRLREVERLLASVPEVQTYSRRTGLALGGGLTEANEGDFFVHLKAPPRRPIGEIMDDVRARIDREVPGIQIELAQLLEDVIGDLTAVPQPIEVKLFGPDPVVLRAEAAEIAHTIERIPGVVDVRSGVVFAGDGIDVHVDRMKAEMLGLDPDTVARVARVLLEGEVATSVQRGDQMVGIRLWSDPELRSHLERIRNLRLPTTNGSAVRLGRVATLTPHPGQSQITREDMQPMVAPTGRISGRDLGSVMRDVRDAVASHDLPAGVYVAYGGLYREQQQSFRGLLAVLSVATLLVFLILLYLYETWREPVAVLTVAALAGSAVVLGLLVTGTELDVASMMGLTMIVGISAEASIFYVSEWRGLAHERPRAEALARAGLSRLRPVLMTALAAILALLPLALGLGGGSSMLKPLALAIVFGLIGTIPAVLLALPVLLLGPYPDAIGPPPGAGMDRAHDRRSPQSI